MKKFTKKQWIKFSIAAVLYTLFAIWMQNLWLLLGLIVLVDIFLTHYIPWGAWKRSKNPAVRNVLEWVDDILFALIAVYFINLFIFQNYQLIPTYNVMQNIIMPLLMRGMTHEEAEEKCKNTIKLLGLDHRIGHKPNELSGGQKQRVSIARALVGQPAILLADEPTGALDQTSGKEVLKLFRELNDMGNTIVMITHDLGVAQSAKRIVRIVDGQLQE